MLTERGDLFDGAGDGAEPLVVVVEQAEELREKELRPVIGAGRRLDAVGSCV